MKYFFVKVYSNFIRDAKNFSKSEILTMLWLGIHADSKGNMMILSPDAYSSLLDFVNVKRPSMYNVFTKLSQKGLISKHGDIVIVNADFLNKHKMLKDQGLTPYKSSCAELGF